jgi:AraC-like DNA-binding protein
MYPCEALFDQQINTLVFDAKYLTLPVVQTPKALRFYLRRAPLDWFSRQVYGQVFTQKVINLLTQNLASSMGDIAKKCHVTTRTLRRKLADERTQFTILKDNLRRDTAIHLLSQTNSPIAEISRYLGFSESAAFSRAFTIWTGVSPKQYRLR